jgi:hypothetical protein
MHYADQQSESINWERQSMLFTPTMDKKGLWQSRGRLRVYVVLMCVMMVAAAVACTDTGQEPEPASDVGTVTVVNGSTQTICFLYTSPSASDDYGEDRLDSFGIIEPGASFTLNGVPPGANDFLAENCAEDTIEEEWEVNVTAGQTLTWTVND